MDDTSSIDCLSDASLLLDRFVSIVVDDTILGVASDNEESCDERIAALEIGREEEVEDNLLEPVKSEISLAAVK